jgi:hypothetical protein
MSYSQLPERERQTLLKQLPAVLIDKIIINHRRAGENFDRTETGISSAYGDVDIMVSNTALVPDMKNEKGKGGDMRRTIYRINREYLNGSSLDNTVVVFLDADVLPEYFGTSGECAGTLNFFNTVSFWQMYGVETGILIDAVSGDYNLADVNLGLYDHEHHNDINIQKMSFGIIRTYLRSLIDYGIITLNKGAVLSDIFSAEYINSDGERVTLEENLTEIKYRPLAEIL